MTNEGDCIEVSISGAVHNCGHFLLKIPATILQGIEAAGGLKSVTGKKPSGVVTVRRPIAEKNVEVWRFTLRDSPELKTFELRSGDLVVIQWNITSENGDSK